MITNPGKMLGELVVATFLDGTIRDIGTAISYSEHPSYEIRLKDGQRLSVRYDLCRLATPEEQAAYWKQRALDAEAKL